MCSYTGNIADVSPRSLLVKVALCLVASPRGRLLLSVDAHGVGLDEVGTVDLGAGGVVELAGLGGAVCSGGDAVDRRVQQVKDLQAGRSRPHRAAHSSRPSTGNSWRANPLRQDTSRRQVFSSVRTCSALQTADRNFS